MAKQETPEHSTGNGLPPQLVVLLKVITGSTAAAGHELATWPVDRLYLLRRDCIRVAELCQDEMDGRVAALEAKIAKEDA